MYDEYNTLVKNSTWILVPKPPNANVVRSMWLFRHKYHAYGSLSMYKARLVANGRTQQVGIDCDDTFSLVVKPATIRTILSLALSCKWPVHQLDVKNAFLNGDISETIYIRHHMRLFHSYDFYYALRVGFSSSRCDSSLFIYRHGTEEFDMTDLAALNYILGISITRDSTGMFLSQKKYALELLDRVDMANFNPTRTPVV
ncbi:ribonuclease H-like domain-containing protein [Tanacetum coccineum]